MIRDHEGVELQVLQGAVLRDADGKASTPARRGIGRHRARWERPMSEWRHIALTEITRVVLAPSDARTLPAAPTK